MIKHANFRLYRVRPDGVILENLEIDDKFVNKRVLFFIYQTMRCVSLKHAEKKKLLERDNKDISSKICYVHTMRNSCLNDFLKMQKVSPEKFCKKAILKNFAIFTGKHLCWRLFLIQNIAQFFRALILKNICKLLRLKMFIKPRRL